jgi:hypothetical protein
VLKCGMEIRRYGPYKTNSGHWFWVDYEAGTGRSGKRKSVLVHREVMEKHLGRKLGPNEVVHHIDHNPDNNDISNLQVLTPQEHLEHHRAPAEYGSFVCPQCGATFRKVMRQIRANQTKNGKSGPFCNKSCASRWQYERAGKPLKGTGQIVHGALTTYKYRKCRCEDCRRANTAAQRARVRRLRESRNGTAPDSNSGT